MDAGARRPSFPENCYDPRCTMNVTPPVHSRAPFSTSNPRAPFLGRMGIWMLVFLCLAGVALTLPQAARAQDMTAFLTMELEIERQLLADDLRLYSQARQRQIGERERVEELLVEVDQQIETGTVILGDLENRERQIVTAEETLAATSREAERLRLRIYDRLRRTGLLEEALDTQTGPDLRLDPLTGRWRVEIDPGNVEGVFTLRLDGTVVRGSYSIEDGGAGGSLLPGTLPPTSGAFVVPATSTSRGSLRGTYAGGVLRLERVDTLRGLHSTFEGVLDPVRRQLRGSWTAVELSAGGPGGGDWTAEKINPEDESDDDGFGNDDAANDEEEPSP